MKYRNYILMSIGLAMGIAILALVFITTYRQPLGDVDKFEYEITNDTNMEYVRNYLKCGTEKNFNQNYPPPIFQNMDFTGYSEDEMKDFLPEEWKVVKFGQDKVILEQKLDEKYKLHEKVQSDQDHKNDYNGYISVYRGKIAIYKGEPPNGDLIEVTRYDVKDVYFDELRRGIKFESQDEKEQILESYTS